MRIIAYLLIVIIAIAMCILIGSCSPEKQSDKRSLKNQNDSLHLVLERLAHENGYLQGYYRGLRKDDFKTFKIIDSLTFIKVSK